MTRRELDIYTVRGLLGILSMCEDHPTDCYPAVAKTLVKENKEKIVKWLETIEKCKTRDSTYQISNAQFDHWLLKGFLSFLTIMKLRCNAETDEHKVKIWFQLIETLEKLHGELEKK